MTPAGLRRLQLDEGCELQAYPDPDSALAEACRLHRFSLAEYHQVPNWQSLSGHPWTIGYGCTGPAILPGLTWSQDAADAALQARINATESALQHALPQWFSTVDPVRQDVLVNIAFNVGVTGLMHWPVTLSAVRAHQYAQAADDIENNTVWKRQVGARADRCAAAMRSGSWG